MKHGKKGSDKGIDGVIPFLDSDGKVWTALAQVKSGIVKSGDIRDLRGGLDSEHDAAVGVFITLEPPTSEMKKEAITAGFTTEIWGKNYPRIQILTVEDLLAADDPTKLIDILPSASKAFSKASRVKKT